MALDTVILQGSFTSDGNDKTLVLRSPADWIEVKNLTQIAATNDVGVEYFFQNGMTTGTGVRWYKQNGTDSLFVTTLAAGDGFTPLDTSGNPLSVSVATTASTAATQPVISTGSTAGLITGSVIRYFTPAASAVKQLGGIDFVIDTVVANTSFRIAVPLATAPGAGGAGSYRIVKFDPLFYPTWRFIASISQAVNAVIATTVDHGYSAGQQIRVSTYLPNGMTEINGIEGNIVSVTATTITTDIDSSTFTAFTYPLDGDYAFTPAIIHPVGETAKIAYQNLTNDAFNNIGFLGMTLAGGADKPAGDVNDVMFWVAGTSFSVDNE